MLREQSLNPGEEAHAGREPDYYTSASGWHRDTILENLVPYFNSTGTAAICQPVDAMD
jgi:hypothetical protein